MMPVHIVRPIGKYEFIPDYSTDILLQGVCHLTQVPKQDTLIEKQIKSLEKFEANREEIYMLLAQGRGVKPVACKFKIGYAALQRYLEEGGSK